DSIAVNAIAAAWVRLNDATNSGRCLRIKHKAKVAIELFDGTHGIVHEIMEMDMEDWFDKRLFFGSTNHQLRANGPARALLASQRVPIDMSSKWSPQHFGQTGDRTHHPERIAMHKDKSRIRVNHSDFG